MLAVNVNSVFRAVRAVLPHMIAQRSGDICVTSSIAGHQAMQSEPVYSASKHALQTFVHAVRRQIAPHNIRIGAISPGTVLNELWGYNEKADIDRRVENARRLAFRGRCGGLPLDAHSAPPRDDQGHRDAAPEPRHLTSEKVLPPEKCEVVGYQLLITITAIGASALPPRESVGSRDRSGSLAARRKRTGESQIPLTAFPATIVSARQNGKEANARSSTSAQRIDPSARRVSGRLGRHRRLVVAPSRGWWFPRRLTLSLSKCRCRANGYPNCRHERT